MASKTDATSIVFDDVKVVLLGVGIAAAITVTVFGSLLGMFVMFVFAVAGNDVTIKELVSPDQALVASIDELRGGGVCSTLFKVYVQSKNKGWFDERTLVGTLEQSTLNDGQTAVKIDWLSSTKLQISYLSAKATKIHTTVYVNAKAVRIYQQIGTPNASSK